MIAGDKPAMESFFQCVGELEANTGSVRIFAGGPVQPQIGFVVHTTEIRRRTRVVGAFPDGQSALNLAAARLRHVAGTEWSTKRYLSMDLLKEHQMSSTIA